MTRSPDSRSSALALRALLVAVLAAVAPPLAGCQDFGDVTGSIGGSTVLPTDEAKLRAYVEDCGKRYERNPGEKAASIAYARALRALTRYSEAVAVIQTAAIKAPKDFDVLGEYGKALADAGELAQAKDVLTRAYTPDNPRWDVMSVQGVVADRLGDHAGAMQFYRDALKIAPGEPGVLTNMGLSLALAKQLPEAEQALRQAVASPKADARMRGDLALVLALEGKFAEAEKVGLADLSPEAARANVEAIRQMIAESDSWRDLRKQPKAAKPHAGAGAARRLRLRPGFNSRGRRSTMSAPCRRFVRRLPAGPGPWDPSRRSAPAAGRRRVPRPAQATRRARSNGRRRAVRRCWGPAAGRRAPQAPAEDWARASACRCGGGRCRSSRDWRGPGGYGCNGTHPRPVPRRW
jgi:Flp pilus assembly protein TadD